MKTHSQIFVSDRDIGPNGAVNLHLIDNLDGQFALNDDGTLTLAKPLIVGKNTTLSLLIEAKDRGNTPR